VTALASATSSAARRQSRPSGQAPSGRNSSGSANADGAGKGADSAVALVDGDPAAENQRNSGEPAAAKRQNSSGRGQRGRRSGGSATAVREPGSGAVNGAGPAEAGGHDGDENADANFADAAGEELEVEEDAELDGEPDLAAVAELDVEADLADLVVGGDDEEDSDEVAADLEADDHDDADTDKDEGQERQPAGRKPGEPAAADGQLQAVKPAGEEAEDEAFVYGDDDEDLPAAQVAVAGATSDPRAVRCARRPGTTWHGSPTTAGGPRITCSRRTCALWSRWPSGTPAAACSSST
jgi:hypothetical protein